MTSFAFILGCVPLAIASGAGAVARQVMGTGVIGGMLTASFIAIFLIPMTFYVVEKLSHRGGAAKAHTAAPEPHQTAQKGGEHA
jgi:HAE1 family hydrophobic/amphiphilic exporter-1